MNYGNPKQYYSKNREYFLKQYWKNNDGTDLVRPNGFKEYPIFIYTAFCQQINKNGKVLDLGCGNGLMLKHLMQYSGYKLIPYGVEFLEPSIKQAKEIIHPQYADNFIAGNMIDYSFKEGPFDFIFLSPHHVHPEDREKFFKKVKENCTQGGKIIFYSHSDVLRQHNLSWVGEFPELKKWNLVRKDYPQVSIGIWENKKAQ
jgi:SAM-dependent methyltransferase